MSIVAKASMGSNIEKLENGVYTAISSMFIDLGMQVNEKFNKTQRKFMLVWDIIGEEIEINGKMFTRTISREYSYVLGDKSNLKRDLQAWRGKPFTQEELDGFDLTNIMNKPCQLQIIKEEKNGNVYNNISSIMSLAKGVTIEPLTDVKIFDIEKQESFALWEFIPSWIQEKIKKALNFESSGLKIFVDQYEEHKKQLESQNQDSNLESFNGDDLPF